MPQINLLSPTSRKKVTNAILSGDPKTELARVLPSTIKRSGICLVLIVIIWIVLAVNVSGKEKVHHEIDEKVKVLVVNPQEIEDLKKERAALEKKVKLIDELSSRKFYWYQKLELLSKILPDGIWFEEISFKPRKATFVKKSTTVEKEQMELSLKAVAVAFSLDDAISLIGGFVGKIEKNPEFAEAFEDIDYNTTKGTIGGLDVMKFDFTCRSK